MCLASLEPATKCLGTALAAVVCIMSAPTPARADMIHVGGFDFQTNAFADTVPYSFTTNNGFRFGPLMGGVPPTSLAQSVIGSYTGDFGGSIDSFSVLQLGFTDNVLRNGPGFDLVLFDVGGVSNRFAVSLTPSFQFTDYREYQSVFTGSYFGVNVPFNQLNAARIDLSDFGVAEGTSLNSITIGLYPITLTPTRNPTTPALTAAGALYPDPVQSSAVPAPPALVLALVGAPFIGLAARRSRRQHVARAGAA